MSADHASLTAGTADLWRQLAATPDLLPARLAAKIEVDTNGCWRWTGATNSKGAEHGHELDHTCQVKPCCNPTHLEPCSGSENCMRHHARKAALAAALDQYAHGGVA